METMLRIQLLIKNKTFIECLQKTNEYEKTREFCKHGTEHLLNVARIAMLLNYEEKLDLDQEVIYAAALLHDIGRYIQYEYGIDHAIASALIAPTILKEIGFDNKIAGDINQAILQHRDSLVKDMNNLSGILYRADKYSRECFFCSARERCDWKAEKKNKKLLY